jgi:peptidoglycan/LPS O-acetylase OafA/YrhL
MGIIRLLLALAVVYGHAAGGGIIAPYSSSLGYFPIDPVTAVQMFFVISGFYMGLVLTENYRALDGWVWKFYLNRYSRLMPSYLIVLALTTWLISPQLLVLVYDTWRNIAFTFSSLTLFGIELTAFYDVSYTTGSHAAHAQLPVPQAWSLGIELVFYLLAPMIVLATTRTLVAISLVLLAARLLVASIEPSGFPWLQRVWPLELYFFLLGILSYRLYATLEERDTAARPRPERWVALVATVAIVLFAGHGMPTWRANNALMLAICLAAALPFVFALSRNFRRDRQIGDFSYPVYLVHLAVLHVPAARGDVWSYMAASVLAAVPLLLLVEWPMERLRKRLTFGDQRHGAIGISSKMTPPPCVTAAAPPLATARKSNPSPAL